MGPDDGTGYAEQVAVDATTIDAHGDRPRGRRARARASANPVDIEPGDYPVVLHHYAVVDLVDMLALPRVLGPRRPGGPLVLGGRPARSRRRWSRLARRRRATPRGCPSGFDAEGVPKQRLALLDAGVCRDLAFDA